MMNENTNPDPQLALLAAEIEKLALSDLPRDGRLEDRIYVATLPVLQGAAGAATKPRLTRVGASAQHHHRRFRVGTPMRIAAGFALVATGLLAWVAGRPAVVQRQGG